MRGPASLRHAEVPVADALKQWRCNCSNSASPSVTKVGAMAITQSDLIRLGAAAKSAPNADYARVRFAVSG
jgi:hypothetical protein